MPLFKFDDIAENLTAKRKPTEADMQTYIGLENLESGSLFVHNFGSDVPIKGDKLIMTRGDILLGKRNAYLKRAAIAPHGGLFSAHGMILRPKEKVIDKRFFPFFIASDVFFDEAIRISVGSLSPTINWRDLKELEFNLPPIEEQHKLADLLWSAYDLKESYKRLLAASDEMAKSRFVEMFGDQSTNPKGWTMGTIRNVVRDVHYGTSRPAVSGGRYNYLRMNNITYDGHLDISNLKQIDIPDSEFPKCSVRRGDVLFNRTNSKELVGKTCVYDLDETMVVAGFIIRVRVNEKMLPEFLVTYLNTSYSKQMLVSMCKAAIGQANINAQEMQNIPIYIPPIEHQNQFVSFIQQLDKSKVALQKSIDHIDVVIKTLLQEHFC